MDVTIVGAGMAGLACGRRLADAGVRVTILDKGRGIGGRVATRRVGLLQFDHGAQHVTASDEGFTTVLRGLAGEGVVAPWPEGGGDARLVGVPGMSALPKALGAGLELRLSTQVTSMTPRERGWSLRSEEAELHASHVVLAIPAPQARALLGVDNPLAGRLAAVRFDPCLTLLAAIAGASDFTHTSAGEPLTWIARDNSKPGRPRHDVSTFIAQAGLTFSRQHLEKDLDAIAEEMLPLFCEAIGAPRDHVTYAAAHRWRYAHVARPLGEAFLVSPDRRLYLGGDWCLGAGIEAAWRSGSAIADDLLARAA